MATIRKERTEDSPSINWLLEQAFGGSTEASIVDALRRRGAVTLSLVARKDDRVVGHILFTTVTIETEESSSYALGLGPMAVLPEYQNRGIGSRLVRRGLRECADMGHEIVVVLGHPKYYPRFGFSPAGAHGIRCEYQVPDEVFMVMELQEGALVRRRGLVRYQPEFREA